MYPSVHGSTIYKSQNMAATYMSINRGINKERVVRINNGTLFSHKRKELSEVDEPRACCTE